MPNQTTKENHQTFTASHFLVFLIGIFALWQCAPGFRPKEFKDFVFPFFTERGQGVWMALLSYTLLIPLALRLKQIRLFPLVQAGVVGILTFLFFSDLILSFFIHNPTIETNIFRIIYISISICGFISYLRNRKKNILKINNSSFSFHNYFWLGFFILIGFFFLRQNLHFFFTRGSTPFGDEIGTWFLEPKKITHEGFTSFLKTNRYTPGILWAIALPLRLFGSMNTEHLFSYAFIISTAYISLLLELSFKVIKEKRAFAFLSGLTLLFFTLVLNRDFHFLFVASLYGEATTGYLCALILSILALENKLELKTITGLACVLSFAAISKPPLSALILPFYLPAISMLVWKQKHSLKDFLIKLILLFTITLLPIKSWNTIIHWFGQTDYYQASISAFAKTLTEKGLGLNTLKEILSGLFLYGSPQFSFTAGIICFFIFWIIDRKRLNSKIFFIALLSCGLNWIFVLTLYTTLWQDIESGSAARYLAQSVYSCILILPLSFRKKSE